VKLWEKSEVVKVAMKRGVSRIDNDRMAAELMVSYAGYGCVSFRLLFGRDDRCDIAVCVALVCRGLLEET